MILLREKSKLEERRDFCNCAKLRRANLEN